ncbi:2-dehydro-3-deoxy-phosphogluconate aldolase [Tianweitania sp.]|uniref:2-dehydro-3-deoxy-phosphogluconate aldolase n=1 Tax=Tianweitania sp. TaxID=2021634 RepID=UPI002899A983|nr:2-dehydro-3-deoxy-phosphogluconate aldolase [Tianweitania sp.]
MISSHRLRTVLEAQPVIPVLRIERAEDAAPLARALAKGGLPAVEITLRTPQALEAIRRVAAEVPEAVVGAGTILNPKHFAEAVAAGATYIVSPGQTPALFDAAADSDVPLLPGATTATEIMLAAERGYDIMKFFPAEQAGGAAFLKSLASPFQGIRFCPTGGITPSNAATYLGLPNVVCVGGSWVAPDALVASGEWDQITALAAEAAKLKTA